MTKLNLFNIRLYFNLKLFVFVNFYKYCIGFYGTERVKICVKICTKNSQKLTLKFECIKIDYSAKIPKKERIGCQ